MSSIGAPNAAFDVPVTVPARHAASIELAEAQPVIDISTATTQMHPHVYTIALGVWAAFLAVFWVTFWISANALFMVVIDTVYAAMFFGVPYFMLRQTPERMKAQTQFLKFLEKPFATIDGSITGLEALLQVILVAACLSFGGIVMGFIIHAARASY